MADYDVETENSNQPGQKWLYHFGHMPEPINEAAGLLGKENINHNAVIMIRLYLSDGTYTDIRPFEEPPVFSSEQKEWLRNHGIPT